ncbi:alpha/beta hydrolase family protein [Salinimicrobium marinum]|nr:alpha/beta fold hydrolase [Salinimicrobium marinum]
MLFLTGSMLFAQEAPVKSEEIRINPFIEGTLVTPAASETVHSLVIMLQGSGPTDRDGNQSFMKNNSFKKIASELAEAGIASFRYDKRIFQMQRLGITQAEMRFDDFITDAVAIIDHFKELKAYEKIVVLGHSQGSLVGMVAAKDRADAFISIAGSSRPIDQIITEQVGQQMPDLKEQTRAAFSEMRELGSTSNYNPVLGAVFNPEIQPFMLSWMQYDPAEELKELDIPILLINGTKDLQVTEKEAETLFAAKPEAELMFLENMNHVLTPIEGDGLENSKSYNEPNRPLHPELIPTLEQFIKSIE